MRTKVMRLKDLVWQGLLMILLAACLFAFQAQAEEPPTAQAIAVNDYIVPEASVPVADPVQAVIIRQLAAIEARNADLAWSLATADFHDKFSSAGKFMGKVRYEYRPLYNHDDYTFLERREANGALVQKVQLRDHYSGAPITVLYRLEQQQDGLWLIDSFVILDSSGQAI